MITSGKVSGKARTMIDFMFYVFSVNGTANAPTIADNPIVAEI